MSAPLVTAALADSFLAAARRGDRDTACALARAYASDLLALASEHDVRVDELTAVLGYVDAETRRDIEEVLDAEEYRLAELDADEQDDWRRDLRRAS